MSKEVLYSDSSLDIKSWKSTVVKDFSYNAMQ